MCARRRPTACFNVLMLHYKVESATSNSTRNTLDCDQSNYSSHIVFSHIPIESGQTGISAIQLADTENPTLEPNAE